MAFPTSNCWQKLSNGLLAITTFYSFIIKLCVVISGLDAFQAEKVMDTLQNLARDGHTVICSIYQPRGSVFSKFDDVVLLTEGSLVYAGPARVELLAYLSKFGLAAKASLQCAILHSSSWEFSQKDKILI